LELDNVSNHYENSVNYHEILENLKDKFKAENTPQTLKVQILTLLPSDWSINKICDVMGATKHMAILSKSLKERKGILSEPEKKQGRPLSSDIKRKVIEFYESDEVSVNLPGKKDCLSIAKDGGKKKPV
ncbi:GSCOCG00006079001-RA-CDS, partial [Cotesia congregata]